MTKDINLLSPRKQYEKTLLEWKNIIAFIILIVLISTHVLFTHAIEKQAAQIHLLEQKVISLKTEMQEEAKKYETHEPLLTLEEAINKDQLNSFYWLNQLAETFPLAIRLSVWRYLRHHVIFHGEMPTIASLREWTDYLYNKKLCDKMKFTSLSQRESGIVFHLQCDKQ